MPEPPPKKRTVSKESFEYKYKTNELKIQNLQIENLRHLNRQLKWNWLYLLIAFITGAATLFLGAYFQNRVFQNQEESQAESSAGSNSANGSYLDRTASFVDTTN